MITKHYTVNVEVPSDTGGIKYYIDLDAGSDKEAAFNRMAALMAAGRRAWIEPFYSNEISSIGRQGYTRIEKPESDADAQ